MRTMDCCLMKEYQKLPCRLMDLDGHLERFLMEKDSDGWRLDVAVVRSIIHFVFCERRTTMMNLIFVICLLLMIAVAFGSEIDAKENNPVKDNYDEDSEDSNEAEHYGGFGFGGFGYRPFGYGGFGYRPYYGGFRRFRGYGFRRFGRYGW